MPKCFGCWEHSRSYNINRTILKCLPVSVIDADGQTFDCRILEKDSLRYDKRGVSASKAEVHSAIQNLDKGLFPNAFCKILPDFAAQDPEYCTLMHADTAGTKTSLAYLYWRETGDLSVWEGIAQDAIVMNLDDMACVGCLDHIILSSTIGRNKNLISGEVIKTLIDATVSFVEKMAEFGVQIHLAGGETADVGDIVRTIDVGYTAFGRLRRDAVLVNNIQGGDVIVGLASYGQAIYENAYNAGMGSNGLTSARHDVLSHDYAARFPESFDPALADEVVYIGSKRLTDLHRVGATEIPIGKMLLSPTRTYLPVIKALLAQIGPAIHGMIHNTGGGQTKVLKFVDQKKVIKDQLFPLPPLFELIQRESGADWREMYQVFNMGHRLEVYLPAAYAEQVIAISRSFGIDAQVVGRVEEAESSSVQIISPYGAFDF
ncbi:MAG TPA: AIR synthase-related protein [Saprospiraceae bacterium]|nr:AIR synthase-related protein [Saprospiraceae bacterium]HMQ84078.1 AIR synthase-related protein [Saprospiraceae bacterium]